MVNKNVPCTVNTTISEITSKNIKNVLVTKQFFMQTIKTAIGSTKSRNNY